MRPQGRDQDPALITHTQLGSRVNLSLYVSAPRAESGSRDSFGPADLEKHHTFMLGLGCQDCHLGKERKVC